MDFNTALAQVKANVTLPNVFLLALLIASEILGTKENIKASSIYGVIRILLSTIKDQVWPQQLPAAPSVEPAATTVTPNNPQ